MKQEFNLSLLSSQSLFYLTFERICQLCLLPPPWHPLFPRLQDPTTSAFLYFTTIPSQSSSLVPPKLSMLVIFGSCLCLIYIHSLGGTNVSKVKTWNWFICWGLLNLFLWSRLCQMPNSSVQLLTHRICSHVSIPWLIHGHPIPNHLCSTVSDFFFLSSN